MKAQPIAVGNALRRLFASAFFWENRPYLAKLMQEAGHFGVGVSGGVQIVAAVARFIHESGEWLLSLDDANAFNFILRGAFLPAVAKELDGAGGYALRVYGCLGDPPPALLYRMESGDVLTIRSAGGVEQGEQGDPLDPVFFSLGILAAMRAFRASAAANGCSLVGILDDLLAMA
ncbi:unnamed protein product, partial [Phaeothamnion confervicola]